VAPSKRTEDPKHRRPQRGKDWKRKGSWKNMARGRWLGAVRCPPGSKSRWNRGQNRRKRKTGRLFPYGGRSFKNRLKSQGEKKKKNHLRQMEKKVRQGTRLFFCINVRHRGTVVTKAGHFMTNVLGKVEAYCNRRKMKGGTYGRGGKRDRSFSGVWKERTFATTFRRMSLKKKAPKKKKKRRRKGCKRKCLL